MSENSEVYETSPETLPDFVAFYADLTKQGFNLEDEYFRKQVISVKFLFYSEWQEISFDEEFIRCAFLLKYSVPNSVSLFEHFQNVYHCDAELFNQLKSMRKIRICCLGGGSGIEIFTIFKAISNFLKKNREEHQSIIKLSFTVVDVCEGWKNWVVLLVRNLKKYENNILDVRLKFLQADLTETWVEKVSNAVKKADILTMVKLISTLSRCEKHKCDLKLIANVAHEMKLDSWIFFLDHAGGGFYRKIRDKMSQFQYFRQCQSFLHQNHLVNKIMLYGSLMPLNSVMYDMMPRESNIKVSSGTWLKCVPTLKVKKGKPKCAKKVQSKLDTPSVASVLKEQMNELLLEDDY